MGFLKGLFGKKEGSCCKVKIEEVKDTKDSVCSPNESEDCEKGDSGHEPLHSSCKCGRS
ncbi:hypothetical protein QO009_003929 [Brevibacillus aydinogluensis]|jgi:hypothetical protein|uniref:Uncharacterized protein n=1 Tax=Brevibacillus aydinogluensis TaxID=927786 RepID=A0AA48RCN4_9BACL|nr:hypothetical protein [Brevibacillus aydinogluensis]CAJ1003075.1 hypothetical protein BSPP4475_12165 [Brevibacillus aydinogluensis]